MQAGDTLLAIAIQFDVEVEEIMRLNGMSDEDYITVGIVLLIPTNE